MAEVTPGPSTTLPGRGPLRLTLAEENALLREEVRTARRASEITAALVVEQFQKMESAQRHLEQQNRYLGALHSTALDIVARRDPESLLQALVRRACRLAGTPHGFIFVAVGADAEAGESASALECQSVAGAFEPLAGVRLAAGEDLAGQVWSTGRPLFVADYPAWQGRSPQFGELGLRVVLGLPLTSSAGVVGVLGLGYDGAAGEISETRLTEQLELFARLASVALDNAHLYLEAEESRRQAEAASEAKSAFLAAMSHEIRTPMNAVIGMTSLLLDSPLSHQQRHFAETIRTSGESLLAIINDILDFSKIEAGLMELDQQPFDLRQCVEGAVDLLAGRAAEKELELACQVEAHTPASLVGDPSRLRQILVNLLGNAVKFTERGEVVVSVTSRPLTAEEAEAAGGTPDADWHEVAFAVRDTGIGIPADRMDRLFRSFSQVDTSVSRRFGGTGLGLAISRSLTALMGGRIGVESQEGQGSTFTFTIHARGGPAARPVYLLAEQPHLEAQRILIVDDTPANREILVRQTRAWGMQPDEFASGQEALARLGAGAEFDLGILDLHMPGMDGITLARKIRELRAAADLPLVLASSVSHRQADLSEGLFADVLTKPLKASQLYNSLTGVLARELAEAQPSTGSHARGPSEFDADLAGQIPLRLLLVEDNKTNQEIGCLLLERLGYRADLAANGLEALTAVARQPYDLVFMDVQMPEMDGLEATRRIRAELAAERQPRIVAMTANAMQEDRDECLSAGMDDYLSKPIRIGELVAALRRAGSVGENGEPRPTTGGAVPDADEHPAAPQEQVLSGAPQSGVDPAPVLDASALARLGSNLGARAAALLPTLIDGFCREAPKLISTAREALAAGDCQSLRRAAHTLKGNALSFGLVALSEAARTLEYRVRDGDLEGAEGLVESLTVGMAEAELALRAAAATPASEPTDPQGTGHG
ncbi:MAG: response regulator [Candidatus Latescibacterota bacterium]|jgi:signal transduction histidine kinase/CheY-like chemotaxis protein/HPt (histidine-containing phosphotransfer) domain-containing protein